MDASPALKVVDLLKDQFFKLNGPPIPGETYDIPPTKAFMGTFTRGLLRLEDAWIAVAGDSGHVFGSDDEDAWFRALTLIAQLRLAIPLSEQSGAEPPFITFVPLEHDQPAGATGCSLDVEHLLPQTQRYISESVPFDPLYVTCTVRSDMPLGDDFSDSDI
ncbi:hypothetical protein ACQKWADRAFT_311486 [Trichoderma austrokoningii]